MKAAIIDDHSMILSGVRDIVNLNENISEVSIFKSAVEFLDGNQDTTGYDIIITDIDMPEMTGTELITSIREWDKEQKILVLSMHKDHVLINNLFNLKINGYLFKDSSPEVLNEAIDTILSSGKYITPEVEMILNPVVTKKQHDLTKREIQIVQLISKGESNKEIASQCFISETTVKTHRKNIMLKLDLRNTAELVRFAIEKKLS
jgi:DNA-binding NarL/FixJ family response regulator